MHGLRTIRSPISLGAFPILLCLLCGMLGCSDSTRSPQNQRAQEVIQNLQTNIAKLREEGRFAEAVPLLDELLKQSADTFSSQSTNFALVLGFTGEVFALAGNYERATNCFVEGINILQKKLGLKHPETLVMWEGLGYTFAASGATDQAVGVFGNLVEAYESKHGREAVQVVPYLNELAAQFLAQGRDASAEPLLRRSMHISDREFGSEHPQTSVPMKLLAEICLLRGAHAEAASLLTKCLLISEKQGEGQSGEAADTMLRLGKAKFNMGEFGPAEVMLAKAEAVLAALPSEDYGYHALVQAVRGEQAMHLGDYQAAVPRFRRAIELYAKTRAPDHPDIALMKQRLGTAHMDDRDYDAALAVLKEAKQSLEKAFGSGHPLVASANASLGEVYQRMSDLDQAQRCYEACLAIQERTLGRTNENLAVTLLSLSSIHEARLDLVRAKELGDQAVQVFQETLGEKHPHYGIALCQVGHLWRQVKVHDKAEAAIKQGMSIIQAALGPDSLAGARAALDLGNLYGSKDQLAEAQSSFEGALKVFERKLGNEHLDTLTAVENLALVKLKQGRYDEALALERRVKAAAEKLIDRIFGLASERQRLLYQSHANIGVISLLANAGGTVDLAEFLLRTKAIVLDSLLEDDSLVSTSVSPEVAAELQARRLTVQRLLDLDLTSPEDRQSAATSKKDDERSRLAEQLEQQQQRLGELVHGRGLARRALRVTLQEVQRSLPSGSVLLEFCKFSLYRAGKGFEPHYGVILIGSDDVVLTGVHSNAPAWLDLGASGETDKIVRRYSLAMAGQLKEGDLPMRELYQRLVLPIAARLPVTVKRLIVSGEGQLQFVNFATLLDEDGRFLAERFDIMNLDSGRDLMTARSSPVQPKSMVVFADPAFAREPIQPRKPAPNRSGITLAGDETALRDLGAVKFTPLQHTLTEARELQARFAGWTISGTVFTQAEANEQQLQSISSPHILHLATHGFFLPATDLNEYSGEPGSAARQGRPLNKLQNPMHRSGLALAGAQRTLDAWQRGQIPPTHNDGILMAQEVAMLNLQGTWLVVLSACDTGIGEARNGEGVMGLRRGFVQAGAQNLLMTLWPISDKWSVEIMKSFYEKAMATGDAPQAMAEVQAEWLAKLRKEKGALIAARIAGPFVLTSRGKPTGK
jgi:CHAT domain-containing protein/tetratricopeptide (TPR) repeat protein